MGQETFNGISRCGGGPEWTGSMKVVLVQSETRFIRGIERVTETLLRHKGWKRVEPYVIFLRPGQLVDRVRAFFPEERMAVIDAGRLRHVHRTLWTIIRMARQFRHWQVDAVVCQGLHAHLYGAPAAWLSRVRNILWCHGFVLPESVLKVSFIRLALPLPADLVLANSHTTLASLRDYYGARRELGILFPSVDLGPFLKTRNRKQVREELGLDPNTSVAVTVGQLNEGKGQMVFLKAAALVSKRVPRSRFLVVGGSAFPDERAFEHALKQRAGHPDLDGKVIFTGHRDDIPNVMAASDVFVHAPPFESFSLVLAEAMASGKPVVATREGDPEELVLDDRTGFHVPFGDTETMADKMTTLLSDPALRARMGREGRKRIVEHVSTERTVGDLESYLERTLRPE